MGAACDHDHGTVGLAEGEALRALDAAEAACAAEGERMTAPRRRVLDLLLRAGEPMKAYDLIARFGQDGQAAKPPTVYRALEFLERRGLAHRIASISAYVACSHGGADDHAAAFLICDCCGAAREIAAPLGDGLRRAAEGAGYAIDRTTIEAHGRCPDCRVSA